MSLPTAHIARARLPDSYLNAKEALRHCAKRFTPERYAAAMVALAASAAMDEIATWPDEMQQLAAYARIADDTEMDRLVVRVERARARWKATTA